MLKRLEVALIVVCLFVTVGIYSEGSRLNKLAAEAEFHRVAEHGLQALVSRMDTYLQSLNGAAGMMQTSENIEFDDFEVFAESLDFANYLPGINGIGFIEPVPQEEEAEFVQSLHESGVPDFTVHPETNNDVKYIIKYIAPKGPNIQAVGLDISFEKGRREAAERARATKKPQLTPRILLVQDATKEPGFLLLRPLFFDTGPRSGEFRGWVYAPFVGRNLLQDLIPTDNKVYDFHVFDGKTTDSETLIYTSDGSAHIAGKYNESYTVDFFGRPWTVLYESTPVFDGLFANRTPLLVLLAGILLTGMLVVVFRAIRQRGDSMAEVAKLRGEQISAREEENRSIIENQVVGIFILDENRDILFANHAALMIFDHENESVGGVALSRFVSSPKDLAPEAGYNAMGTSSSGQKLFLDYQQNNWVTLNGVKRTTAIVRDVTDEVQAVKQLGVIKERYDLALSGSEIGVFALDLDTNVSTVSPTWLKIMGFDRDVKDPQGAFMDRIHPDDLPRLFEADKNCIEGVTKRSIVEYRVLFEDKIRWMRSDAVIVERDADGKATRMVGTQTDVTSLLHSRNALEDSERRFRTVLEAAPVGMATLNDQGYFTSVNPAMCALTGYSHAELLDGTQLRQIMEKEDLKAMREAVLNFTKNGVQETYRGSHRIIHKNGNKGWGLFNITWTYDKNADAFAYIAQVVDITDQKKIEEIKNEFVSTVSHELRTPLTSIKGALGLIEMSARDKLPASALRLIEIARNNSDRLTTIVNDILDLEKITSGNIHFDLRQLNMETVVENAVQEMLPFAVTHETKLVIDAPSEPVDVMADWARLMQVLANLISNACKYSAVGTDVTVKIEKLEGKAIVYVQNFGTGVPEAFKNRIFQAFSQADGSDTRAKGGTGLGLNITRQIVWRLGGSIGFESTPGGATVFWFTCPLADADAQVIAAPSDAHANAPLKLDRPLRVLHLEDDVDFAEVLRAGLTGIAEVKNVTHLRDLPASLAAGPLDVIILDWTVPDGDAASLLDEIIKAQPSARLLSLTSDAVREKDARVGSHMIKSQSEMSSIIECVSGLVRKAG